MWLSEWWILFTWRHRTKPIEGETSTGISKKKDKVRAWVKSKKDGVKMVWTIQHLPIFAVSKLTDKDIVHFEKQP